MTSIVEHGSSIEYEPRDRRDLHAPWRGDDEGLLLFASARQALVALTRHLDHLSGVRRILLPDHYCHATTLAVRAALSETGVAVELYPATFGASFAIETAPSDLVVVNAAFGVLLSGKVAGSARRVLDATHAPDLALLPDPDGAIAHFDYAFASLKKLLPLTDGGALTTIGSQSLPSRPPPDADHEQRARELERLLHLKHRYVGGQDVDKRSFYPVAKELEVRIVQEWSPCAMSEVAMHQLATIDVRATVGAARRNVAVVLDALRDGLQDHDPGRVSVLRTETFVALLCRDALTKRSLVERLIGQRIYPATLWPTNGVDGVSLRTQEFVDRLIVLNADARYSVDHMRAVTDLLLTSTRSLP